MDKLMPQSDEGCRSESENKRKRRLSTTQSDESPKKKTVLYSVVSEYNKNKKLLVNSTKDISVKEDIHENTNDEEETLVKFLLEDLCDEILYEIFKFLDTWSLMALMNVSKRFENFVLDKRLWENIDLCQQPLPLGILEDMLERSHDKTKCIKLKGPSPCQHIEGEIKHFNQTIRSSFTTRCTKLVILELYGVTLDFNQIALKDFPQTIKRLVLNTCNVREAGNKSLFTGINTILVNLEELAIENNSWFDPYYVMSLSKLPLLRYLSLKGCWQMQEFIPYGSIAARYGFKQLEVLDLRDTPLNDSDLQCFNAVETLKEIYLQYPEDEPQSEALRNTFSNDFLLTHHRDEESQNSLNETQKNVETPNSSPSTSTGSGNKRCEKNEEPTAARVSCSINDNESSSSSSSSSSCSPRSISVADNNSTNTSSSGFGLAPNIVPLVGTNVPPRSRFLPRPDHILSVEFHISDPNYLRHVRLPGREQQQNQQQSPPPVIEQMIRHNLFWDIVNPLGRVVGVGARDQLFAEENVANYHSNLFSSPSSNRQQSRGTISDRGVCGFGRTRQPVQQGVIWIRFNNRPSENRFERFSVRDYKFVTDVSLQHLVQCSPHLIFLDVSGTGVTLEGLQRFKNLKPECNVVAEHLLSAANSGTTVS